MKTYTLFRIRDGDLYPLYVEADRKMETGVWLEAHVGELADETHVKSRGAGGRLALRPGFHSTSVPFTDWIGRKMPDGSLVQRRDTVWCECEVDGDEIKVTERWGLRTIPDGYYFMKLNPKQDRPWVISNRIKIIRILTHDEAVKICGNHGIKAQPMEE